MQPSTPRLPDLFACAARVQMLVMFASFSGGQGFGWLWCVPWTRLCHPAEFMVVDYCIGVEMMRCAARDVHPTRPSMYFPALEARNFFFPIAASMHFGSRASRLHEKSRSFTAKLASPNVLKLFTPLPIFRNPMILSPWTPLRNFTGNLASQGTLDHLPWEADSYFLPALLVSRINWQPKLATYVRQDRAQNNFCSTFELIYGVWQSLCDILNAS